MNWYALLSGQGDNDPSTSAGNAFRFTANGYNGTSQFNSNPLGGRGRPGAIRTAATSRRPSISPTSPARACVSAGASVFYTSVGNTGWKIDDVQIVDGASNVLFWMAHPESGPGKWSVSSPTPSSTPW